MGTRDALGRICLALDTCKMNPISNFQVNHLTRLDWHSAGENRERYRHTSAVFVGSPSPLYNCHGLTFASKRTQVDGSTATIHWILREDDFEELPPGSNPQTGDVVIYYDDAGEVVHSGIVMSIAEGAGLRIPKVWSKWGKSHEVVHALYDCPYSPNVRYFRMRPWQQSRN